MSLTGMAAFVEKGGKEKEKKKALKDSSRLKSNKFPSAEAKNLQQAETGLKTFTFHFVTFICSISHSGGSRMISHWGGGYRSIV